MNLEQATKRLLIKSPFYGLFLLSLKRRFAIPSDDCKTAYVHINGINYELIVNEEFWNSLDNDDCRLNLLQHELLHICLKHLEFSDRFPDSNRANIAEDLEVSNYTGFISPGGWYIWEHKEMPPRAGSKVYYDLLPKSSGDQSGQGGGQGSS